LLDCKTEYVGYRWANEKQHQGGLSKAMTKFGMGFSGRKHDALDDAFNTFVFYRRLLKLKIDRGVRQ